MKIWTVTEQAITWLPGFQPSLLTREAAPHIRIVINADKIGLEVGGVVGSVTLNNGDTLHIQPKVGDLNFLRMIFRIEDLQEDFDSQINSVLYQEATVPSLPRLVSQTFLKELASIRSRGIRFGRKTRQSSGRFLRGKIIPFSSVLNLKMKKDLPILSQLSERNKNVAENRLLAAAAKVALKYGSTNQDLLEMAEDWMASFPVQNVAADVAEVNRGLRRGGFRGSRGYYVKGLTMAKVLLGQTGFVQGVSGELLGQAILLNTANLFEQYIRAILISSYKSIGLFINKGGLSREFLYHDNTFRLVPDICVMRGTQTILIADVKYKEIDSSDHYQMYAYLRQYDIKNGVIFFPEFSRSTGTCIKKKTKDGIVVTLIGLPVGDLDATEELLGGFHEEVPFLQ